MKNLQVYFIWIFLLMVSCTEDPKESGEQSSGNNYVDPTADFFSENQRGRKPSEPSANFKAINMMVTSIKFKKDCERLGLIGALKKDHPEFPILFSEYNPSVWKGFFGAAIAVPLLVESENPVSAYLHPYSDAVFFVEWSSSDPHPEIARISAASGVALMKGRETRESDTPRSFSDPVRGGEIPFPFIIMEDAKALLKKLEETYPPFGNEEFSLAKNMTLREFVTATNYIGGWMIYGLYELEKLRDPEKNPKINQVLKEFGESLSDPTKYKKITADNFSIKSEEMQKIPKGIFSGAVPCFVIPTKTQRFVYYVTPLVTKLFVVAQFDEEIEGGLTFSNAYFGSID